MAKKATPRLTADARIVLLYGPEQALVREHLRQLKQALEAEHGEVEQHTFDGREATLADVLDELRSYSLMQLHKLVVVDEAEVFTKSHRAALERYAENPVDHGTLVLRSSGWRPGKLDKLIEKVGAKIKCDTLRPGDASAWLVKRAPKAHGVKIEPAAAGTLVDRLGPALSGLDQELAKLALAPEVIEAGGVVTQRLVDQRVGRSSDEKAWAVQEAVLQALADGRPGGALRMVHELVELAGHPEQLVSWAVTDLARKLATGQQMRESGAGMPAIHKAVRNWGPQARLFEQAMQRLAPGQGARLLHRSLRADARSKSGLGDAMGNLEALCVQLVEA
jgi:DNA polymerase III delta subunit